MTEDQLEQKLSPGWWIPAIAIFTALIWRRMASWRNGGLPAGVAGRAVAGGDQQALNPDIPLVAREAALRTVQNLDMPALLSAKTGCFMVCWSTVCRWNTRRMAKRAAILCG